MLMPRFVSLVVVVVVLLLLATAAAADSTHRCPTHPPRALSFPALCGAADNLEACLEADEARRHRHPPGAAAATLAYLSARLPAPDWPKQRLRISLGANVPAVRVYFVNLVGREIDWGALRRTTTSSDDVHILDTFVGHAWRVYDADDSRLLLEIIPEGRIPTPTMDAHPDVVGHFDRLYGFGGWEDRLRYHDVLWHTVSDCAGVPDVHRRGLTGVSADTRRRASVGGDSSARLHVEARDVVVGSQRFFSEWPPTEIDAKNAHLRCKDNLGTNHAIYPSLPTSGVALHHGLKASDDADEVAAGSVKATDLDRALGRVVANLIPPTSRLDMYVSRTLDLLVTGGGDEADAGFQVVVQPELVGEPSSQRDGVESPDLGHGFELTSYMRLVLRRLCLHFLDAIFIRVFVYADTAAASPPEADDQTPAAAPAPTPRLVQVKLNQTVVGSSVLGPRIAAHSIQAVVRYINRKLIDTDLVRSWGVAADAGWSAQMFKEAWAVSIREDLAGPSAGQLHPYGSVAMLTKEAKTADGFAPHIQDGWQLLMEGSRAGSFLFSGSVQSLHATFVTTQMIQGKDYQFEEVTRHHPWLCNADAVSPPMLSVLVRRDTRRVGPRGAEFIHPDALCAGGNYVCNAADMRTDLDKLNADGHKLTWRSRTPPGGTSLALNSNEFRPFLRHTESSWERAVLHKPHPRAAVSAEKAEAAVDPPAPNNDNNNDNDDGAATAVPWPEEHRRKRFVIDGLLSPDECQALIRAGTKIMISGATYSGEAREAASIDRLTSAPWQNIAVQTHTPEQIAFGKLYRDALSRVRAATMAYFNLTELHISNTQLTGRQAPGVGHCMHSDDCLYRNSTGLCEPSNKVHECCVNYHYSAILFLTDQPEVRYANDSAKQMWGGSTFFWHENIKDTHIPQDEVESLAYPRRTRVNNKCGRMVGFTAGEENPHGVESLHFGPGADPLMVRAAQERADKVHARDPAAMFKGGADGTEDQYSNANGGEEEAVEVDVVAPGEKVRQEHTLSGRNYSRFVLTNWFSTDIRFLVPSARGGYTVSPHSPGPAGRRWREWVAALAAAQDMVGPDGRAAPPPFFPAPTEADLEVRVDRTRAWGADPVTFVQS